MSQTSNPYKLLKLPSTATPAQIEAAYDRLYTQYEAHAQQGDDFAVGMLERLNEAYDTLTDEDARAELDQSLSTGDRGQTAKVTQSGKPVPGPSQTVRARPRSAYRARAVQPIPQRSMAPYIALGVIAVTALVVLVFLLIGRPGDGGSASLRSSLDSTHLTGDEATRGSVVATVNGRPIYEQDYLERIETDKAIALADPIFGALVGNFETVTGTRALDILNQDALDRLINLEILQQQAVKEGIFPTANQQPGLIDDAKTRDLASGVTFEQFLQARNITPQQYNRRVIRNVIYAVMANAHMPTEGTTDERTEAFSRWICDLRKSTDPATGKPLYDVKINLTFLIENPPCTSGLPPDIALPGIEQEPPEPISTPAAPAGTPSVGPPGPPAP
jgi:hypothetical protein